MSKHGQFVDIGLSYVKAALDDLGNAQGALVQAMTTVAPEPLRDAVVPLVAAHTTQGTDGGFCEWCHESVKDCHTEDRCRMGKIRRALGA